MYFDTTLALIGSNSVHTLRYLNAVAPYFNKIIFVSNKTLSHLQLPSNIVNYELDFRLHSIIFTLPKIAAILNKHKITLVHIQQANSYAFHTLKAIQLYNIKCKVILTTWGSDILLLPNKNLLFKYMVKYSLSQAHIITSDSLYMSSKIRELAPQSNICTINFGMQHFPQQINLREKKDIIFSNRLHKKLYNIEKIIYAFASLITNPLYNNYRLVIAASGPDTQRLMDIHNNLNLSNKVIFTGMLSYEELVKIYLEARLFISIPTSDATSLSLIEAMAHGCYPILSNIPANLEWVIDGVNGTICQNNNSLSGYMEQALDTISNNDNYTQIASFNHDLVKQKAVFENNIRKFLLLYL